MNPSFQSIEPLTHEHQTHCFWTPATLVEPLVVDEDIGFTPPDLPSSDDGDDAGPIVVLDEQVSLEDYPLPTTRACNG